MKKFKRVELFYKGKFIGCISLRNFELSRIINSLKLTDLEYKVSNEEIPNETYDLVFNKPNKL
jgi:hypothetical protein